MRNDKRNYALVGAFVLAMLVALVAWILLVTGRTGPTDAYAVVFDNVGGLKPGVEILYEGYPVGLIEQIEPVDREGRRRFRVGVDVRRGWPIPADSRAKIAAGLFSAAVIDIEGGKSADRLPPGSEIAALEGTDMMAAVNAAANRVNEVLDTVADSVPGVMGDVERLGAELNEAVDQINAMLTPENVERIGQILRNVDGLTVQADSTLRELGETRKRVDTLILRVDQMLEEERGDVARAMTDLNHSLAAVARHIDAISANLEATTRNMSEFSKQVRDNPGILIRGREQAGDGS